MVEPGLNPNVIAVNLAGNLRAQLRLRPYPVLSNHMRLSTKTANAHCYAAVVVRYVRPPSTTGAGGPDRREPLGWAAPGRRAGLAGSPVRRGLEPPEVRREVLPNRGLADEGAILAAEAASWLRESDPPPMAPELPDLDEGPLYR
jgi:hypothetical protein